MNIKKDSEEVLDSLQFISTYFDKWTSGDTRLSKIKEYIEFLENENKDLRTMLWLNHGCDSSYLYGDDGEKQCNNMKVHFPIDFVRDTTFEIVTKIKQSNERKIKKNTRHKVIYTDLDTGETKDADIEKVFKDAETYYQKDCLPNCIKVKAVMVLNPFEVIYENWYIAKGKMMDYLVLYDDYLDVYDRFKFEENFTRIEK